MTRRLSNTSPNGPVDVRVPKTAELVAAHVRKQIVRGDLRQGDALPTETALMEEYSISRPTLREAFRILESEGLIIVRRGARGGARVLEPSPDAAARYAGLVLQHRGTTLLDVLDVRVMVEAPAARLVASDPTTNTVPPSSNGSWTSLTLPTVPSSSATSTLDSSR